jgi:hypothetical protein
MNLRTDAGLLDACHRYLSELSEIHEVSFGNSRDVSRILDRIERRLSQLSAHSRPQAETSQPNASDHWVDDIVAAYGNLGGTASHRRLYVEVKAIRLAANRSLPRHWCSLVRQTLQAHCSQARQYGGGPDLFRWIRNGYWGLKQR